MTVRSHGLNAFEFLVIWELKVRKTLYFAVDVDLRKSAFLNQKPHDVCHLSPPCGYCKYYYFLILLIREVEWLWKNRNVCLPLDSYF